MFSLLKKYMCMQKVFTFSRTVHKFENNVHTLKKIVFRKKLMNTKNNKEKTVATATVSWYIATIGSTNQGAPCSPVRDPNN